MEHFLEKLGYSNKLSVKNRFAYIIAGVGIMQLILFLLFYIFIVDSNILVIQTVIVFVVYSSALVFFKNKLFYFGKIIVVLVMVFQVFLLSWVWFPKTTYFMMYFFVVPPLGFIVFDLEIKREKASLIWISIIVSGLIVFTGVVDPIEKLTLESHFIQILRVMTITMTFFVQLLVFYFYAFTLSKTTKELRLLANTDALTNVSNRRVLFDQGALLYDIYHKYNKTFTLMILDLDHFKVINDKYGHPIGDKVLKELTELISKSIRKQDLLCRYGGEEFAILLKDLKNNQKLIINTIRDKIANHRFYVNEKEYIQITFSAGVITCKENYSDFIDLVVNTDKLLYKAKATGRNRIIFDSGDVIS
ncbi:MAG: diguanylate cyclase [Clostridiales bacterium]|nr:diguanylate cyclase [Clostridiales bacterium]